MNNHLWRATLVVFTVMLPISTIGRARAHDYQHPELNSWYESLRSGKGPCCDGSDAKRVDDADWETKDGHYRVRMVSGLMFRTTYHSRPRVRRRPEAITPQLMPPPPRR